VTVVEGRGGRESDLAELDCAAQHGVHGGGAPELHPPDAPAPAHHHLVRYDTPTVNNDHLIE
jgi:hypothetical protein